jgi:sugar-specific transcriptional regulator TrmB
VSARKVQEPLETFKILLINRGILTDKEAEVYTAVIDMGQATATTVYQRLRSSSVFKSVAKQTVHRLLTDLKRRGLIKSTVTSGKRGHSTVYKAIPPETPLSEHFNETEKLKDVTEQIVALMEQKSEPEEKIQDQNLWIYEPQKIALKEGLKCLENAKKSVLVYCNDYTWAQLPGIMELLKKKMNEKLDVRIIGGILPERSNNCLKAFNRVMRETDIPCLPYCLMDKECMLFFFNDIVLPGYKVLQTKNAYMVERYSAQFEKIWANHSRKL